MVEQLIYQLETDILGRIAYYLSRGSVASADWQTMKLRDLGLLSYDVQRIINKYRGRILLQTGREVEASADDILRLIRENSPKGKKLVATRTDAMRDIINTWVSSATSKTNIAMATLAQSAGKKYVAAVSKASLSVITGTDTLQKSVMRSIGELEKLDAFVDSAGRTWTPEGYVKMVVRSNQRRVSTETMFQAAREGDTDLVEVSSHAGARPKCAPYQGKIYSISGNHPKYPALSSTSYGEPDGLLGINCVLEGTLVSGPAERAVYRRKYTGELITIRTSHGHELTVTPNHPILTDKGWVAANLLEVGSNVVSRAILDGEGGIGPNPNHGISAIEDKFNLLFHGGDVFSLSPSACNFHGDIPDHEVDVVFRKGFLWDSTNATFCEHIKQDSLHCASKAPYRFKSISTLYKAFFCSLHSFHGIVSRISNRFAPVFTASFMDALCSLGFIISKWNAKVRKIFSDRPLANTDLTSNFILPESRVIHGEQVSRYKPGLSEEVILPISAAHIDAFTFETIQDCLDGAMFVSCDGSNGNTGEIQIDRIVDIKRETPQSSFVHVYNLQTETGWYFSNGIISHNCGHVIYPYFEGLSKKTYEPYPAKENRETYEQSQQQRAYERKIRYYKRKEAIARDTVGGEQEAAKWKARVKESQAELRGFIDETGRTRQRDREAIYT